MLGLMKFKKLFWKKSDEHDKLDELDHEFIAGFTKREIISMIQNMLKTRICLMKNLTKHLRILTNALLN